MHRLKVNEVTDTLLEVRPCHCTTFCQFRKLIQLSSKDLVFLYFIFYEVRQLWLHVLKLLGVSKGNLVEDVGKVGLLLEDQVQHNP